MKIAYGTDIHGDLRVYEKLLAAGEKAGAVVIGGDLSPGLYPQRQREFFASFLLPRLRQSSRPVLLIMGNDDYMSNRDLLELADKEGTLQLIHNKTVKVGGFHFTGYQFVNTGPLIVRDWLKEEGEIRRDLEKLKLPFPRKTVFVSHAPPRGTALDMAWGRRHVGSLAIRGFLEREQPLLSLHGHIHESPQLTGRMEERLGKTLAVNPGSGKVILIDLRTLRIEMA